MKLEILGHEITFQKEIVEDGVVRDWKLGGLPDEKWKLRVEKLPAKTYQFGGDFVEGEDLIDWERKDINQ